MQIIGPSHSPRTSLPLVPRRSRPTRPPPSVSPDAFLVRLNLSSQTVQYVGAQIVRANSFDDVQVRGIENPQGAAGASQLSDVQGTKLQYVSNQNFNESELRDLLDKYRTGVFQNSKRAPAPFAEPDATPALPQSIRGHQGQCRCQCPTR